MGSLGQALRLDRLVLWERRRGGGGFDPCCRWARPGCAAALSSVDPLEHDWVVGQASAGRPVVFRTVDALPREAQRERRALALRGPRSAAVLPLAVAGTTAVVISAGALGRERSFGRPTLGFLEAAGQMLTGALMRKRSYEASVETEGRLGGVLEASPDGILLVSPSGHVVLANGRATAILRRPSQELCAVKLQDVLAEGSPATHFPGGTLQALLASEEPRPMVARRGDGSNLPVEVTLRSLRTPGQALLCCGIRDATQAQRLREEVTGLRDELAFMGRTAMVTGMGAGIAHELNQPLTAILSNAETAQRLLRRAPAPETADLHDALEDVVKETHRAADVLGRMRDMLHRHSVERVPVDVTGLLTGVVRRFQEEAVARSIQLSLDLEPGVESVRGDPVQLEQVVMNLVLNAFEALGSSGAPPRTVALRARRAPPAGVDLSIRDSGPGLEAHALAHAFDPFFTTKASGLGMGLPISRSIVEAHGGRLLARNNADRGATFELHLPAAGPGESVVRRRPA